MEEYTVITVRCPCCDLLWSATTDKDSPININQYELCSTCSKDRHDRAQHQKSNIQTSITPA